MSVRRWVLTSGIGVTGGPTAIIVYEVFMRILNSEADAPLNRITLYLTTSEARELLDSLSPYESSGSS